MFFIPLNMNHFHIYWTKYLQVNIASQGWKLSQSTGREFQHCTERVSSNLRCLYPIFVYFFWHCNTSHSILGCKVFGSGAKWQFCVHSQTRSDNKRSSWWWKLETECFAYQYFQDRSCVCFNTSPEFHFSRSVVADSASPWTAARQASLSITNFRSLLKRVLYRILKVSWSLELASPVFLQSKAQS